MSKTNRLYFLLTVTVIGVLALLPTFFRSEVPKWFPAKPIRLGLDLRGGSYLVFSVQTPEAVKSHLAGVAQSVRAELKKDKNYLKKLKF